VASEWRTIRFLKCGYKAKLVVGLTSTTCPLLVYYSTEYIVFDSTHRVYFL